MQTGTEHVHNHRSHLLGTGKPSAEMIKAGAAVMHTDTPTGKTSFYETFDYPSGLGQSAAVAFKIENGISSTAATRGVLFKPRDSTELLSLQSRFGRSIKDPEAHKQFIGYQDFTEANIKSFGFEKAQAFDAAARQMMVSRAIDSPGDAVGFGIVRPHHTDNWRLYPAQAALYRPDAMQPPAKRALPSPPPSAGGSSVPPVGAPGVRPQSSPGNSFAGALCAITGAPLFEVTKFKAAKLCFKMQMYGSACARGSCPMVNGMTSLSLADRDLAFTQCHAVACSHCGKEDHLAGCHAQEEWLAANPALAAYPFP
jgi:hypothetical protein